MTGPRRLTAAVPSYLTMDLLNPAMPGAFSLERPELFVEGAVGQVEKADGASGQSGIDLPLPPMLPAFVSQTRRMAARAVTGSRVRFFGIAPRSHPERYLLKLPDSSAFSEDH